MSVWGTIHDTLANDPTLVALLGPITPIAASGVSGDVWYDTAPPGTKFPYITFRTSGQGWPEYTFEATYKEPINLQIQCYAEDAGTATTIAARVDQLLNWQQPTVDNARILQIVRNNSLDNLILEPKVSENDFDVWQLLLIYECTLIRNL
jgi:hypothetical protein